MATTAREAARGGWSIEDVRDVVERLGIDLATEGFDLETLRAGMAVELEHGRRDPRTNVTDDDPSVTAKIAWAHLRERTDSYDLLEELEARPVA